MFAFGTQRLDGQRMHAVCARAYASGFRIFDTALVYGNQPVLGAALKAMAAPPDLSIVSKIHQPALAGKGATACVRQILAELQRDRVDTVLIHAPRNVDHVAAMRDLLSEKDAGRIGRVGVSNYTLRHLEQLASHGIVPDVVQTEIHPFLQEEALVRHCHANGIEVMGHTGFANGQVFGDAVLAETAAEAGIGIAELVLRWAAARGIVPVISTIDPDRVPSLHAAPTSLPGIVMDRIARLDAGTRICNDPAWAEF